MKARAIYAVVGMPYSGSTLLSFIIGSHPEVYNGADLHHLNGERKGVCSLHKLKCAVFSEDKLAKIYGCFDDCDAWYDEIADAVQRPIIFDASKQLDFFKRVLPVTEKEVVVIALNKHPLRALASDVYNRLFARQLKIESLPEIHEYFIANKSETRSFILKRLDSLRSNVHQRAELLENVSARPNIKKIVEMSYESYVRNPGESFAMLLSQFGLQYDESFLQYTDYEHHPVTGNMAPIWKVKNSGKAIKKDEKNFRKNYYLKDSASIVLDDKYKELFPGDMIGWIESQKSYRELLSLLGYQPMQNQSVIKRLVARFR